ncbi:MAG: PEP-CTERM sorting domain-containing protein [Luteolibacter sp.]|uniref:PEP-CTERM sorting domain-containing protein n=1 Tax=Luteolibacter sp. TaxID=1962973 RepID=UPI003264BE9C
MKIEHPHRQFKKTLILFALTVLIPGTMVAQTLIDSGTFYDPEFKVRQEGATSGTLTLSVDNTLVNDSQSNGTVTWNHTAGGHAQVRSQIVVVVPLANLDAQLAAFTQTVNDSLIFGREITTDAEILGVVNVGPALQGLVNQVAGASVIYNWQSEASVSGLAIAPNQLYQVDFTVTSGNGLPVNLLQSATFGITTAGVTGASNESASLLNLLDVVTLGNNSSTGNFSFTFKSSQSLSALDFTFDASTVAGVSLLGGTAANQNVLTFSGFQVNAIPEPSSLALSGICIGLITLRRKRNHP